MVKCFDRKRSSSGQYRIFLSYNKLNTQLDPIECSLYCTLKTFSIGLKMTVYGRNMLP